MFSPFLFQISIGQSLIINNFAKYDVRAHVSDIRNAREANKKQDNNASRLHHQPPKPKLDMTATSSTTETSIDLTVNTTLAESVWEPPLKRPGKWITVGPRDDLDDEESADDCSSVSSSENSSSSRIDMLAMRLRVCAKKV